MSVKYTDPALVTDVRITKDTPPSRSVTGYGAKIPTAYQIRYKRHWYRVYAMVYGNAASVYIHSLGEDLFLDLDTEHKLQEAKVS